MRRLLAGLAAAVTLTLTSCSAAAAPAPTATSPISAPTTESGASSSALAPSSIPAVTNTVTSTTPTSTASTSQTSLQTSTTASSTPISTGSASTTEPDLVVTVPASIIGANRRSADAGIAAWRNAMHVFDLSLQDPTGRDWKPTIYRYMGDPAAAEQVQLVETFVHHSLHQVGFTRYYGSVTKAAPQNVEIRACTDVAFMDVVDASGHSDTQPGEAKRFYRNFYLTWYSTKHRWLLNYISTPNPAQPC